MYPQVLQRGWSASLAWLVTASLATYGPFSVQLATAQTGPALAPIVESPLPAAPRPILAEELAPLLETGSKLEQQRDWAGALTHYEDALRHNPGNRDLSQRLAIARSHYDIARRYGDASYTSALSSLTDRDALAIYDEVLLKIQSHYVTTPQWQQLLQRGTSGLGVALTEPAFLQRNLPGIPAAQLKSLKDEVVRLPLPTALTDRRQAHDFVEKLALSLNQRYQLPPQAVILEFTCGATGSLDDYSGFLTGSQMDEVFSQIEGNFVGLGVELKTEPTGLLIVNVITGGPAATGGIRVGDRIVDVDGHSPADTAPDALADLLRGEEGSHVSVSLKAAKGDVRTLDLIRRRVEVPSVDEVKLVDKDYGIGYFKITSFQKTTARDVDTALWKLHDQGMKSLVIDLRGNPGGLLKAAVDVADKFVMDGMIVATRGRSPREDYDHKGQIAGSWRVPLVVLIDRDSASASEIFAGAIRDHRRGTIVGERSYGKGSVQGIFPLAATNAGVRLTTARWYTPSGQAISGQGVSPDVAVQVVAKRDEAAAPISTDIADAFMRAGLQVARSNLSRR